MDFFCGTKKTMKTPSAASKRLMVMAKKHGVDAMAEAMDCTRATIYNLMSGDTPSLRLAIKAEKHYKIPPRLWVVVKE